MIRDVTPAGGERVDVQVGAYHSRALWWRLRRVTSLDVAEYEAAVLLTTPVDELVSQTRRAMGTEGVASTPPPAPPPRPEEDAPPEAWDAYVVAVDEYAVAVREWKHAAAPEVIAAKRRAAASMGRRDRERLWREHAALFCAAVVETAIAPEGAEGWVPSPEDWSPERFALEETESETGIDRLPPGVVEAVAGLAYQHAIGGEVARKRVARFRARAGDPHDV